MKRFTLIAGLLLAVLAFSTPLGADPPDKVTSGLYDPGCSDQVCNDFSGGLTFTVTPGEKHKGEIFLMAYESPPDFSREISASKAQHRPTNGLNANRPVPVSTGSSGGNPG